MVYGVVILGIVLFVDDVYPTNECDSRIRTLLRLNDFAICEPPPC